MVAAFVSSAASGLPYFAFLAFGAHGFAAHGFLAAQGFWEAFFAFGAQGCPGPQGFLAAHGLAAQGLPIGAAEAK